MPFDENFEDSGGGRPDDDDLQKAIGVLVRWASHGRPEFKKVKELEIITAHLAVRVSDDGESFAPFAMLVADWSQHSREDF